MKKTTKTFEYILRKNRLNSKILYQVDKFRLKDGAYFGAKTFKTKAQAMRFLNSVK